MGLSRCRNELGMAGQVNRLHIIATSILGIFGASNQPTPKIRQWIHSCHLEPKSVAAARGLIVTKSQSRRAGVEPPWEGAEENCREIIKVRMLEQHSNGRSAARRDETYRLYIVCCPQNSASLGLDEALSGSHSGRRLPPSQGCPATRQRKGIVETEGARGFWR